MYSSPSLKQKPPVKPKPVFNVRGKFLKDAVFKETPSSFDDVRMFVYICTNVCLYVCICTYYLCIFVCTYVHTYVQIRIYI